MSEPRKRVLILASGAGSLAKSVLEAIAEARLSVEVVALLSDKESPALKVAASFGVPTIYLPLRGERSAWSSELLSLTSELEPDLVASLGFMKILAAEYTEKFLVINSHPSLLPNFPGAHAVRDALAAGSTVTGCTIHHVDEGVDTGPIIAQRQISIPAGASESELHEAIKIVERSLIVEVLEKFATKGNL